MSDWEYCQLLCYRLSKQWLDQSLRSLGRPIYRWRCPLYARVALFTEYLKRVSETANFNTTWHISDFYRAGGPDGDLPP